MADSILSITVRDSKHPCSPYFQTQHQFFVDILHCDGKPLTWKGITYVTYPLKERIHDQIRVPQGCYIVRGYSYHCPNVVLELAMVHVPCKATVCVSLLPTPVRYCLDQAIIGLKAGTDVGKGEEREIGEVVPERKIRAAISALEEVKKDLSKYEFPYKLPVSLEELEKMQKEAEKKKQRK